MNEPVRLLQLGRPVQIEKPFSELYYLATPYSDPEWETQEERYRIVTEVAAVLIQRGHAIFSPITHNFPLTQAVARLCRKPEREGNHYTNFHQWENLDKGILQVCCCLLVLGVHGWMKSRGVREEMLYAESLEIPIEFIFPEDLGVPLPEYFRCAGGELQSARSLQTKRPGFQPLRVDTTQEKGVSCADNL